MLQSKCFPCYAALAATGDKISYTYTGLKQLRYATVTNPETGAELFKTAYAYKWNGSNLTPLVEFRNVRMPDDTLIDGYKYEYDQLGNITAIYESELKGTNTERRQLAAYTYDDQSQLLSETIYTYEKDSTSMTPKSTTVYTYTYDTAGNLLTESKNGTVTKTYSYDNSQWNDLLTKYNGTTITYDSAGNPTTYHGGTSWEMTWSHGRSLTEATHTETSGSDKTVTTLEHAYDADGIRTRKTLTVEEYEETGSEIPTPDPITPPVEDLSLGGSEEVEAEGVIGRGYELISTTTETHDYITQNGKVVRETITSGSSVKILDFIYDESGKPFALQYTNGTANPATYYYVLNLQGDVLGLINASGTIVARYTYNAWGEILTATGTMAEINPLRYRGYYYDTETGFYYLQSRYYDPVTHRFINADSLASTGQGAIGTNMFAYCNNGPIISTDPSGCFPELHSQIGPEYMTEGGYGPFSYVILPPPPFFDNSDSTDTVDDQGGDDVKYIPFGFSTIGHGGCGAVAIHDAFIMMGKNSSLRTISRYIGLTGQQLLGGLLGMSPSQLASVLTQMGYSVYMTSDPDEIANYSKTAEASILWYAYTTADAPYIGAHFTAYESIDGGYLFHNVGPTGTMEYSDPYAFAQSRDGFLVVVIFICN